VLLTDALGTCEVGDGACDAQTPFERSRGHAERIEPVREQVTGGGLDTAVDEHHGHVAVERATLTCGGERTSRAHARRGRRAQLTVRCAREALARHGPQRQLHVDAVQERPGQARAVALEPIWPTRAGMPRVTEHPAGTRVGRRDELDPCGQDRAATGPVDDDVPVLQRLPQCIEDGAWRLEQLVHDQHAVMRERELTGSR
jgi:hypothetical protein